MPLEGGAVFVTLATLSALEQGLQSPPSAPLRGFSGFLGQSSIGTGVDAFGFRLGGGAVGLGLLVEAAVFKESTYVVGNLFVGLQAEQDLQESVHILFGIVRAEDQDFLAGHNHGRIQETGLESLAGSSQQGLVGPDPVIVSRNELHVLHRRRARQIIRGQVEQIRKRSQVQRLTFIPSLIFSVLQPRRRRGKRRKGIRRRRLITAGGRRSASDRRFNRFHDDPRSSQSNPGLEIRI